MMKEGHMEIGKVQRTIGQTEFIIMEGKKDR